MIKWVVKELGVYAKYPLRNFKTAKNLKVVNHSDLFNLKVEF